MRTPWLGLVLVTLLPACLVPRGEGAVLRGEILEITRHLEDRYRSGDLLGVADLYADDALILAPDGQRIQGRDEIDAYWSRIEEPVEWRLHVWDTGGSGNLAYALGTSHLTSVLAGEEYTTVVEFMILWRRDDAGTWRIAVDTNWQPAG